MIGIIKSVYLLVLVGNNFMALKVAPICSSFTNEFGFWIWIYATNLEFGIIIFFGGVDSIEDHIIDLA